MSCNCVNERPLILWRVSESQACRRVTRVTHPRWDPSEGKINSSQVQDPQQSPPSEFLIKNSSKACSRWSSSHIVGPLKTFHSQQLYGVQTFMLEDRCSTISYQEAVLKGVGLFAQKWIVWKNKPSCNTCSFSQQLWFHLRVSGRESVTLNIIYIINTTRVHICEI